MTKETHTDYQKLQYFFSGSEGDIQAIKQKRKEGLLFILELSSLSTLSKTKSLLMAISK